MEVMPGRSPCPDAQERVATEAALLAGQGIQDVTRNHQEELRSRLRYCTASARCLSMTAYGPETGSARIRTEATAIVESAMMS